MGGSAPDPVFVLRGVESPVTALTFLCPAEGQSDSYVAAGTQDGKIFVWNLKVWIFNIFYLSMIMKITLAMSLPELDKKYL